MMECSTRIEVPPTELTVKEEESSQDLLEVEPQELESIKKEEVENDDSEAESESEEETESGDSDSEVIYYIAVDDDEEEESDPEKEDDDQDEIVQVPIKRRRKRSSENTHDCEKCDKSCKTRTSLSRHLKLKHFFGKFKCDKCDKEFNYADELYNHSEKIHSDNKITCPKCGKECNDINQFTNHYTTHSTTQMKSLESFVCDICGKSIKGKYALRDHMNVHTGLKPYKCNECDFSSPHSAGLSTHRITHLKAKGLVSSHICEVCGKSFSSATYVREHKMIIHEGKKLHHECNVCGKRFTNVSTMCRHKAKFHRSDDATTCKTCGYVASFKNELKKHEKSHQEGEFACRFCGKVLKTKYSIAAHERMHTGDSPYACNICDFRCKSSASLWKHRNEKHSEKEKVVKPKKSLTCHVCGKEFTSRDSLNGHLNMHTGNKPYKCDQCDYASTHRAGLFMHKKKHAKEKGLNEEDN